MARSGSMESLFTTFRDALFSADHHADDPAPRAEPDDAQAKRRNFVRQVAAAGGAPQSPEATVKEATAAGATGRRGAVMDSSGSISPVRPVSLGKSRSRSERRHAKHIDHGDQDAKQDDFAVGRRPDITEECARVNGRNEGAEDGAKT